MKFKNPVSTVGATRILGVYKVTLWNWGKQGKIRMYRENGTGPRIFDADELKALAPRLRKDRMNGFSLFPPQKKPK